MSDIKALEKQVRILTRALERSEQDRIQLEDTKEKNDSLLRKVIGELEDSKAAMQNKSDELKVAIVELQEAQTELVHTAKMASLGELVAGIAHEINTPMTVGLSAASRLAELVREQRAGAVNGSISNLELEEFLSECEESAEILLGNLSRGSELIQSFKLVAVDQSKGGARLFDVGVYLAEVARSVSAPLKKSNLQFTVNGPAGVAMNGDPGLIAQVVTNLVMNAIIHAYDEGESGKLTIDFEAERDFLLLTFADDGKGIPEADLPKIYNPFFTTRRGQGGSGLGLNIIYNIVTRELGGTIACRSVVGEGTRFIIRIPGLVTSAVAPQG